MTTPDKKSILQEIPLFAGLTDEERALIESRCVISQYVKGDIIYREGSPADAFYCIVLGRVLVYTQAQDGSETHLDICTAGNTSGLFPCLRAMRIP